MSENDRIEELISAYTIGVLDGEDLVEAERIIKENPEKYKKVIRENELAISQTAHSISTQSPRAELKDKLFDEIRPDAKIYKPDTKISLWEKFQPFALGLAAASIVVIVALGAYIYSLDTKLRGQESIIAELQTLVGDKNAELALLTNEIGEQTEMLAFLENPEVVIINLVKTEEDITAVGRVLWNPNDDEAMFYALDLPEVPQGKTYQLWAIADGEPKNAGVFSIDERGNNVHVIESIKDIGDVSAFAVSLEPAGGVLAPTGKIYLLGETEL